MLRTPKKKFWNWFRLSILGIIVLPIIFFVIIPFSKYVIYFPREGDIVFQSLNRSVDLVRAIEGVSQSHYSHCGVMVKEGDSWYVNEAFGTVKKTPWFDWYLRGRDYGFWVYRINSADEEIEQFLLELGKYQNRPYDVRYRLDDEYIYCSELVYKAYLDATGKELGELESLGSLNWEPYRKTIKKYEGGEPPLDRKMITPISLSKSEHLDRVL